MTENEEEIVSAHKTKAICEKKEDDNGKEKRKRMKTKNTLMSENRTAKNVIFFSQSTKHKQTAKEKRKSHRLY